MKSKMLLLVALICFISLPAWAKSPATSPPDKEQAGVTKTTDAVDSNAKGGDKKTTQETPPPKKEDKTPGQSVNCCDEKISCGIAVFCAVAPAIIFLAFILVLIITLKKSNWSLADALSESETTKDPDGKLLKDKDGNPVYARSSSRLLAFVGFFGIILWVVGLSIPTLYQLACTGKAPELNGVSTFILAQAGVFTPYIFNKVSGAVKS